MFEEDPLTYACRLIVDTMTRFACLIELALKYLFWVAWFPVRRYMLRVRGWIAIGKIRLQGFCSDMYWEHINTWLVVGGFRRELTWVEIEERRLRAIARTGEDIPRPPALEAGLRQELSQQDV